MDRENRRFIPVSSSSMGSGPRRAAAFPALPAGAGREAPYPPDSTAIIASGEVWVWS